MDFSIQDLTKHFVFEPGWRNRPQYGAVGTALIFDNNQTLRADIYERHYTSEKNGDILVGWNYDAVITKVQKHNDEWIQVSSPAFWYNIPQTKLVPLNSKNK